MSLRTFFALVSVVVIAGILILFSTRSQVILGDAFSDLESVQTETVSQAAKSILQAREYGLRTFRKLIEDDNDFSSSVIVARSKNRWDSVKQRLDKMKKDLSLDLLEVTDPKGEPPQASELSRYRALLAEASQGKSGTRVIELSGEPTLISFAPLRNFGEVSGGLILGISLNKSVREAMEKTLKANVRFASSAVVVPQTKTKPLEIEAASEETGNSPLGIFVIIDNDFLKRLNSHTQGSISYLGAGSLVLFLALLYALLEFGFVRRFKDLLTSLGKASADLDRGVVPVTRLISHPIQEIHLLSSAFARFTQSLTDYESRVREKSKKEAFVEVAEQVAHDLKSPLSALDMMLDAEALENFPEKRRVRLRACLGRIKETIQVLSNRRHGVSFPAPLPAAEVPIQGSIAASGKDPESALPLDSDWGVHLLTTLVEELIAEKRIQYRSRPLVQIEAELGSKSYGLFADLPAGDFKRALSNLIDNSVQAISGAGEVKIRLFSELEADQISLEISDTGQGIPPEVIGKLGNRGATFGKTQGTGLGLWNAKEVLTAIGGTLSLNSRLHQGTTVKLRLPRAATPHWFADEILLSNPGLVVVLDDDEAIHHLWDLRLASANFEAEACVHFKDALSLLEWHATGPVDSQTIVYLFDYELLGQSTDGLEVIERLKLAPNAFLVTSHFENKALREKCARLGVKIIPKEVSGFVPIRVVAASLAPSEKINS